MKSNFPRIGLAKLCGWLGISRQVYYQYNWEVISTTIEEETILQQVRRIRANHRRMGTRKLYELLQPFLLAHQIKIGRDALFDLLAANHCFWEEDLPDPYRSMVHRSWNRMFFASGNINLTQTLEKRPYHYLPGEAFFRYFHEQFLPGHPIICYPQQKAEQLFGAAGAFSVQVADQTYRCKQVYNSGFTLRTPKIDLWQHFKGWVIALEED